MAEIYTTSKKVWDFINLYTIELNEAVGTGDGSTTLFSLANKRVIDTTLTVKKAGVVQTLGTDYTVNLDLGRITFTVAPGGGQAITADYSWADVADSVVKTYIDRVQDEIDRRLNRIFRPVSSTTEFYDAESIIDINPFAYQPTTYNQEAEIFKDQWESPVLNKYIKLNKYPITKVTALELVTSVSGGVATTEVISLPVGGATEATNGTADILLRADEGIVILRAQLGKRLKRGQMNVKITYEFGASSVPLSIEDLATKMVSIYVIESRLLGSPQPLSVPAANIRAIREDIEFIFRTVGEKLELKVV